MCGFWWVCVFGWIVMICDVVELVIEGGFEYGFDCEILVVFCVFG